MEGDVFHNAIGESCVLKKPYDNGRVQTLRNNVSVARTKEAIAKTARDAAHKDWADCKRKLFCNASTKNNRLNARENEHDASKNAFATAEADLKQALNANSSAQTVYDKCHKEVLAREKQEAELKKKQAELQQQKELTAMKVGVTKFESGKDYALYGLIGLGAISSLVIGYLIFKK